jgi:hypothetical protein
MFARARVNVDPPAATVQMIYTPGFIAMTKSLVMVEPNKKSLIR